MSVRGLLGTSPALVCPLRRCPIFTFRHPSRRCCRGVRSFLLGPADSLVLFFRHHHHLLPPRQADEAGARAFTSARPPFPHDASDAWDRDRQAPALASLYSPQPIAHHPLHALLFLPSPLGHSPSRFGQSQAQGHSHGAQTIVTRAFLVISLHD